MKLPGADRAEVAIAKLRDYCLSPTHPRGRHKARVFLSSLGLAAGDASWLRDQLLMAAQQADAAPTERDDFGQRYVLDFPIVFSSRKAIIRSCWIVKTGEDHPRLTSCFVI